MQVEMCCEECGMPVEWDGSEKIRGGGGNGGSRYTVNVLTLVGWVHVDRWTGHEAKPWPTLSPDTVLV